MKKFYWTGICHEARLTGISRVQDCINQFGSLMDFKFFSDLSVGMVIEIEERYVQTLYEHLMKIVDLSNPPELTVETTKECLILLNVTFTKGTGDMTVEVPAVPG